MVRFCSTGLTSAIAAALAFATLGCGAHADSSRARPPLAQASTSDRAADLCAGLPDVVQERPPFLRAEGIETVRPVTAERSTARFAAEELRGAEIVLRPSTTVTKHWVTRVLRCHLADPVALSAFRHLEDGLVVGAPAPCLSTTRPTASSCASPAATAPRERKSSGAPSSSTAASDVGFFARLPAPAPRGTVSRDVSLIPTLRPRRCTMSRAQFGFTAIGLVILSSACAGRVAPTDKAAAVAQMQCDRSTWHSRVASMPAWSQRLHPRCSPEFRKCGGTYATLSASGFLLDVLLVECDLPSQH